MDSRQNLEDLCEEICWARYPLRLEVRGDIIGEMHERETFRFISVNGLERFSGISVRICDGVTQGRATIGRRCASIVLRHSTIMAMYIYYYALTRIAASSQA